MKFELVYDYLSIQQVSHYNTGTIYIYIYICVYVCVCVGNATAVQWISNSDFLAPKPLSYDEGFINLLSFGINSRVFLLLNRLPYQGWTALFTLLFTHSWRENNWIYTFLKGISSVWNAISFVKNLNSCLYVNFQQR